jgi:hypothetical protein
MKANRAYHLIVSRDHPLTSRERQDRIEIVSVDDGEVVLYWELAAKPAAKLIRALRTDLAGLDAEEFLARWIIESPPAP